jgi:hypothetical protein
MRAANRVVAAEFLRWFFRQHDKWSYQSDHDEAD